MGLAALLGLAHILSRVVARGFCGRNETRAAIICTTNGLLDSSRGFLNGGLLGFFEALVEATLSKDLRAGEASDTGDEFLASGHLLAAVSH
jgi:hypothetical protein